LTNTWWKDPSELIKEQSELLDIPTDKSLLLKGPPGSGKTNLMLLRANQLFLGDRPNLHIVVFGSLLKQFIRMGGAQYKFPEEKVVTHSSLFSKILWDHGWKGDVSHLPINQAREIRAKTLADLISKGKIGTSYQALFLDEAQDYTEEEIRIFRKISEVLVATADTRQRIYNVPDNSELLVHCTDIHYPLKYHFRNGLEICRLADGIVAGEPDYAPMLASSQYDEKSYPCTARAIGGLNLKEQAFKIAEQLKDALLAYPDQLLAVLCPKNDDLDVIQSELNSLKLGDSITRANNKDDFDSSKPIWLSTIHAAKGLEFRVVHIAGLDGLSSMTGDKRLIYTGVTRGKTTLRLYWQKSIPGYLDAAIRTVAPSPKAVTKANIFGQ
jgi:superfamily I DNA and RNA helicase